MDDRDKLVAAQKRRAQPRKDRVEPLEKSDVAEGWDEEPGSDTSGFHGAVGSLGEPPTIEIKPEDQVG